MAMKTVSTGIIPLIYAICMSACSSAVKHERSDRDSDSTVSQPVMVGGAYLTCSVESIAVESSNVGVGCAVSESEKEYFREKNVKVVLHKDGEQRELSYQPAFDMLDPDDRSWNILDLPKDAVDGSEIEIIFPDGSSSRSLVIGGDLVAKESSCDELRRFEEVYNRSIVDQSSVMKNLDEAKGVLENFDASDDSYLRKEIADLKIKLENMTAQGSNENAIRTIKIAIDKYSKLLGSNSAEELEKIQSDSKILSSEAQRRVELAEKAFNEILQRTGKTCQ